MSSKGHDNPRAYSNDQDQVRLLFPARIATIRYLSSIFRLKPVRCHAALQSRRHRTEVAEILGGEPHLRRSPAAQRTESLRARHVPLPQWGWTPRRASGRLHGHRHRMPLSEDAGRKRHAPHGLGRLRTARRATRQADRHPSPHDHGEEYRQLSPATEDARLLLRLAARAVDDRYGLPPLDAVHLPGAVQHVVRSRPAAGPSDRRAADSRRGRRRRPRGRRALSRPAAAGLSTGSGGELVSGLGHGAGQRGGPGGRQRARRAPGRPHAPAAVDAADHGLCRPAGARPRRPGLAGEHQTAATQLDRPQHRGGGRFLHRHLHRGRRQAVAAGISGLAAGSPDGRLSGRTRRGRAADLYHPGRHALRRHLHGDCPRASALGAADRAEQAEAVRDYCQRAARKSDLDRTDLAKEKTGVFTGSYAINPVNGEAIPIWAADYVLISYGTGAIMAVPAHDTRDFDFARQFDLPIRCVVDPGSAPGRRARSCWPAGWRSSPTARRSIPDPTTGCPRPSSRHASPPICNPKAKAARRSTTSSAIGSSAASTSGASRFPSCTSWTRRAGRTGGSARAARRPAGRSARAHGLRRHSRSPRAAAGGGPGRLALRAARRQAIQAGDQHDAAMGRLLLVLPPLPRSPQPTRPGRSGGGKGVDAGRSLRGRGGTCRLAPALRPLLAQSALRPRPRQHAGALPEAGQPGDDPGRDGVYRVQEAKR